MADAEVTFVDVGDDAPDFRCNSQLGEISFHDYITGSWTVFFSHPADFTPVCTTEFGMISKLADEFEARNCKIVGLSIDSVLNHEAWIKDINETQDTQVDFPILADERGEISSVYGFSKSSPEAKTPSITNRTLLIIDPQRKVQLRMTYPANTGRNFYEIIRILDSLQLTEYHQVGTPANWKNGEDVLIMHTVSNAQAKTLFPKGFTAIKPYLRITPMPEYAERKES